MCRFDPEVWCAGAARLAAVLTTAMLLQACSDSPQKPSHGATVQATAGEVSATKPTQVAARVNSEELTVHQLNERMAAWTGGAGASGVEDPTVGRGLNRLIELTLLRQEAEAQGLANKPDVMRQLMAARAEVLARAMALQLGEEESMPPPQEVRRYFDEHPEAFARRQVVLVQELRSAGSSAAHDKIVQRLQEFRSPQALARALEREGHRAVMGHLQVGSDQLPLNQWSRLKGLELGQAIRMDDAQGLRVWWLQAFVDQPIEWERAQALIERQLGNQLRAERVRREIERLRQAAKVEYVGDFSRWSPEAGSKPTPSGESAQAADPAPVGR